MGKTIEAKKSKDKSKKRKIKMATKCEQMMQNMIKDVINQLEQNGALKISTEEAFALFDKEAPNKVSKGVHKVVEKEMDEEEAALKMLAEAEEAVARYYHGQFGWPVVWHQGEVSLHRRTRQVSRHRLKTHHSPRTVFFLSSGGLCPTITSAYLPAHSAGHERDV